MCVVENSRLAVDAAGKCDSPRDGCSLGRKGALEVAGCALYTSLDRHTLQSLLPIALRRLMVPECFRLGEQLRGTVGVTMHHLDVGELLPCIRQCRRIRVRASLLHEAFEQCRCTFG